MKYRGQTNFELQVIIRVSDIKGTLPQIWKSPYMFVFI